MEDLWILRRTGRRRRGTTLTEVRGLFEEGITAKSIHEDLDCCRPGESASEVRRRMEQLNFDLLGVSEEDKSEPIGYVRREDLTDGRCDAFLREFKAQDLISASTPLARLFYVFQGLSHRFVLVDHQVTGIVTRADLQKPPVRLFLFSLVTLLEMHLTALVRKHYESDEWTQELSDGRLNAAKEFQEERKTRDQDLDLVDCVQFCDKRDLVLGKEVIRDATGIPSKRQGGAFLRDAEALRDNLAHSQQLAHGADWESRIETVLRIEEFLERSEQHFEATP